MRTVFIADDHKIIRESLRVLFERNGGFQVVGEAADGRVVVEQVLDLQPQILVTDMAMNTLNGIGAVRQLRAGGYLGVVVMLSMHNDRSTVADALGAGVNAFVHKDLAFEQIMEAIGAAERGELWLSPDIAAMHEDGAVFTLGQLLSEREREVLQLLAEGRNTKEIGGMLQISPKTVETHRLNLFAKLKVNNVVELTRIALREKLVQL